VRGEDYALRPVRARGVYEPRYGILLDNKVYRGRAGYHIITPLKIDGSDMYVLVVRGWAAGGPTRDVLPEVATPAGVQTVQGIGMVPSTRVLELKSEPQPGPVWQNLLLDRYRAWSHLKLQPFVIEQTGDAADDLVRDWPRPDLGVEKHRVYMMQWYAFTALALLLYVVLNFKRNDGSTRQ
jgi:surfeit locus 1 family protein